MPELYTYLDDAKRIAGIRSDRELSARLGQSPNYVGHMRKGKFLPKEDHVMVQLALLGGHNAEQALMDLGRFRAEKTGDIATASMYKSMGKLLHSARHAALTACLFVLLGFSSVTPDAFAGTAAVQSDMSSSQLINYAKKLCRRFIMFLMGYAWSLRRYANAY